MSSPYQAPLTNPQGENGLDDPPRGRKLAVTGSIFLTGPLFGAVGTVGGMMKAFSAISSESEADAAELSSAISVALLTTIYGLLIGIVGAVLVSIALFKKYNREKWFFRVIMVLAVIWSILLFPVGLVVGGYLLFAFLPRRDEFKSPQQH